MIKNFSWVIIELKLLGKEGIWIPTSRESDESEFAQIPQ